MTFEEKMKLAVQMADYRVNLSATGGASRVGSNSYRELIDQSLPNAATFEGDRYAQVVRAMFNLIESLEHGHRPETG